MNDQENLQKALHSMGFAVSELRDLSASDNPLLADVALDLLADAVRLEQRLARLNSAMDAQPAPTSPRPR